MKAKLEDIKKGVSVRGVATTQPVQIVSVDWICDQAISVVFRDQAGDVQEAVLYRDDEERLELEQTDLPWSFDADGAHLRLVTEANRINLAYFFDPYLAVHSSLIDPLPHQISAVYGEMLPRQPLRFLLADDPGAGKTIMAGLLMKELAARSDLERCLVVAPGSLVEQWQDELGQKFNLEFTILTRDMIETSRSGNPFEDCDKLIVRLDMLARDEDLRSKLLGAPEWDLIICDEAHRMSATYSGGEVRYTRRYQAGQTLGQVCRHLLLMSATPHNGKEADFQLFMALLDGDRFEGRFRDGVHYTDTADMMRRLTKEELRRFDGRPLFPERYAYTVKYELSGPEMALYSAVTEYVRNEMNRVKRFATADKSKRNNVGFALQILQRRLASSPAAIYQSLKRRRERLEDELVNARDIAKGRRARIGELPLNSDLLDNVDEYDQEEVDRMEETVSTGATMAQTVEQLELEVETLKGLEKMGLGVLRDGLDAKWTQLHKILDEDLMRDAHGHRRKLIIFTEPKDTLHYLLDKVRARLGDPNAVDVIHGGVSREARRQVIERFMQDKDMLVLIANDAAGEGVNLQRGHLMVNYDLPWNPNKIEQRFGRIHRIGQTEVCHLWNLVAAETREGEVYARLLEKLEAARTALGGRVYDVLGELFEGAALKDLLFEAIQYGEQEEVKARLFRQVDGAVDQEHLLELLRRRALTNDSMPVAKIEELRLAIERAEASRLQPHHIQSFFVEAFQHLGGRLKRQENGRWEIASVPGRIRDRDREIGTGVAIRRSYERVCFEKEKVNQQPVAEFISPGHPLLESVISLIREEYEQIMRRGAVMIDDADQTDDISAIVLLEHSVQDGRTTSTGKQHVISQRLQFVSVRKNGQIGNAGIAPHLNLRPAIPVEMEAVAELLGENWLKNELEKTAIRFATVELAQRHVAEVKERRIPEIEKVEREVRARLTKEIAYWNAKAFELQEQEKTGKNTRLNWQNAQRRAEELAERLKRRLDQLARERVITSQPARARGGMVVIPRGLLIARGGGDAAADFQSDASARRRIELAAMAAVMATERELGNSPEDVSSQKLGYDIASYDPRAGHLRFIEVKGRADGAETVTITRQEVITSLHEPIKFILAVVSIVDGIARPPHYIRGPLTEREPGFIETAIQFDLRRLLERAEAPQ